MTFDRDRIADPARNAVFVVPAIALSLFVFAYSVRIGAVSILAFYGVWTVVLCAAPRLLLERPLPVIALLVLPAICLLSTIWSDAPERTLRSAIQYGTTVFFGLVAARATSVPNLALGGAIGGLLVLLYSVAIGGYSYDFLDGSYAFNGAFSSKNQLGYFATLTILFCVALLWAFRIDGKLWPAVAATAGLGVVLLWMSDSATSILTTAVALVTVVVARMLLGLPPALRRRAVATLIAFSLVAALAAYILGLFDAVLLVAGKDATLTGRTFLWNQALEFGASRPLLGVGYDAFWVHDRPEAERLWEEFYITARTGFHFHNVLIEAYVGLGLLGLTLVSALCLALFAVPVAAILAEEGTSAVTICAGLALLFLPRAMAEVDFITPYTVGSFLVPFVLLKLLDHRARGARPAPLLSDMHSFAIQRAPTGQGT
ncbi:O-antigen ligase [uncultured Jannaschia sp.]|uniref:O-antigen ligase family protein n=1 Tax=uncultured Jannaschia sp. TaxID=293347 RepID=UPI00262FE2D5|nr:O-antigen ligase [uncultured Jannaschia sp.]